jgi:tetratricopeptide (TPR) repeat protein
VPTVREATLGGCVHGLVEVAVPTSETPRLVRMFVSHTSDMATFPEGRSFVQAVLDAAGRAGLVAVDMRYFAARDGQPAAYCRERVRDCEIYVAVIGFRYGSMVPGETVSYTELEFNEATAIGKPRLIFVLDETADIPVEMADTSPEAVEGFRRRLRAAGLIVRTFTTDADLELEVFHALVEAVDTRGSRLIRQLPPDVSAFTGRSTELAELDGMHDAVGQVSSTVAICAVSGTAGVGKTALAVHWAHEVADRFPDGQLYVDLRGCDADQPMLAGDALAMFLRALGVDGADIPYEVAERATRYRTLLAGRRMLVVLDNATSPEHVRMLLPGSPSCMAVVTSRDSLAALVARHGAQRIELDLLPLDDAVALLRTLIGGRVDIDLDAAATLARQCARLPLALRVAAELASARPITPLAELVEDLTDEQRRLDLLGAGGDFRTAARAVFSWSYRNLSADVARLFRLIGQHPGPDLEPNAIAAFTHSTVEQAKYSIDVLTRAHLFQRIGVGRYAMHDLLRAYAAGLAATLDNEHERRTALTRLFDHYLATAATAMNALYPAEKHRRPHIRQADMTDPPPTDPVTALAWLEAERPNLVALCAHMATYGWPSHATRLAATLFRHLNVGGHYSDALTIHTHAQNSAAYIGDRGAEAHALTNLGLVHLRQGRHGHAADHFEQALTHFRETNDTAGEARALGNLGLIHFRQGRYAQAVDHYRQALTLFREGGDQVNEARALGELGVVYGRQGHYAPATTHLRQGLALFRMIGDATGEATTLADLGVAHLRQGYYTQAANHLLEGLILFRETGDRFGQAHALTDLGVVHRRQGHYTQAADHHQQALTLFRETGDRAGAAKAFNNLGETLHAAQQSDEARGHHAAALTLAIQTGDRYEQARAHHGLAHTQDTTREHDQAHYHWQHALTLYTDLVVPDADDVRASLTTLNRRRY